MAGASATATAAACANRLLLPMTNVSNVYFEFSLAEAGRGGWSCWCPGWPGLLPLSLRLVLVKVQLLRRPGLGLLPAPELLPAHRRLRAQVVLGRQGVLLGRQLLVSGWSAAVGLVYAGSW